jgi:GAF domain-containing protein
MPASSQAATTGLGTVLRRVVDDMRRASGAEMVSLVLYDEELQEYFAPFAVGQPEDSLLASLTDMREQLSRYLADVEQGKVPDELSVQQYGSTVWLTVTRRTLVARDAPAEIDSTFVRRYHVTSTVGLPLLAADRLLGIVYLNYRSQPDQAPAAKPKPLDDERIAQLEKHAAAAADKVEAALDSAERVALEGMGRLSTLLTGAAREQSSDSGDVRRLLSIALSDLLLASELDAGVIYEFASQRTRLDLVTANAPAAAPVRIGRQEADSDWEEVLNAAVGSAMASSELRPVATFPLGSSEEPDGYLVALSRDRLATVRRAPTTDVMLKAGASLIGGTLANQRLISDLASANRLLGVLDDMTRSMLLPGSSRQDVLEAVVTHLTDAEVPEFDFHFATVYLLDELADGTMLVRMAAGASTVEQIRSAPEVLATRPASGGNGGRPGRNRVPTWALDKDRVLAPQDILVYAASSWQPIVVGGTPTTGDRGTEEMLVGGLPEQLTRIDVPVQDKSGKTVTMIPAALVGDARNAEARQAVGDRQPPFTLAADVFERGGHGELIRIFLPFGFEAGDRATGVLEVGYHRSLDRRPSWGQVEALRAAAAQVAVAVETARLYEEARHHAEQLELSADVSKAIASSIDLEQTLRLVARNLVRLVDASLCQIALLEEDGEGWFGAAASDQEEAWKRQHGEHGEQSFVFEVLDRGEPLVIEDVRSSPLVDRVYTDTFGVRSLLAIPLVADGKAIGVAVLAEREQARAFTTEEVRRTEGLAHQAAVAIKNARLHGLSEEERHIQKDFVLIGFGQWGKKAYQHLQTLKQFFNFRIHVVEHDSPTARERMADGEKELQANGDTLYWDNPANPARAQLARELESSCYVITYVATPAATHLPTVARYYDMSDVMLIEKPLGASPEAYREFLDSAPGGVEIVAADHYYFKLEVRLLQMLLTEERTLRAFLESVEEIQIEILEEQPLTGAAADIGVVADLIPHAFAIISVFTPIDHIELDPTTPLLVGRHETMQGKRESYARMKGSFPYQGRSVRLVIDVGKGVENAKWIKLSGERPPSGRRPFYKFDFGNGEAIDGTQSTVRAAIRRIREPGVKDNAHMIMLRHVIEKRRPAVGILSIREAIRANQRIQELEALAGDLLERNEWTEYPLGTRPTFAVPKLPVPVETDGQVTTASAQERARARG